MGISEMSYTCVKCQEYGLEYVRNYKPEEFIEGKTSSSIWIIGINPARESDWEDPRTKDDLSKHFEDHERHQYFKTFESVSRKLYEQLGDEYGVAHTDLIKCFRKNLKGLKPNELSKVVDSCQGYLLQQIRAHRPELLICNGSLVSDAIQQLLPPTVWLTDTAYRANLDRHIIAVVLSGFVSQMDAWSRKRLGREIDTLLDTEVIEVLK